MPFPAEQSADVTPPDGGFIGTVVVHRRGRRDREAFSSEPPGGTFAKDARE